MEMQESMTSTSCIAGFSRIAIPLVRRLWPSEEAVDSKKKRKKSYRVPQIEEHLAQSASALSIMDSSV